MSALPSSGCCNDTENECPPSTLVPGPQGEPGTNGTNGTDGINSFTLTTASFVQPAVSGTVTVEMSVSSWMTAGQNVAVQTGGEYQVAGVPDSTHADLINLGYPGNAAPTTVIPSVSSVSPSGKRGATGASGAGTTLNSISPTTARGDLMVDNGAGVGSASVVRQAAGTNGKVLAYDSGQATGVIPTTILPNTATDNAIVRFDGTAGLPVPGQDSGLIITDDGAIQSTGGNARGSKSVDLQVDRAANDQVSSGANATISGGKNNKASGPGTVASGFGNSATGDYSGALSGSTNAASGNYSTVSGGGGNTASGGGSTIGGGASGTASAVGSTVSGGQSNTASGDYSSVGGGDTNVASGVNSTVPGGSENIAGGNSSEAGGTGAATSLYGQKAYASGYFNSAGDCQFSRLNFRNSTTDATPTNLVLDGSAAILAVANDTVWGFKGLVLGVVDNGDSALYEIIGLVKNVGGTTSVVGSATVTSLFSDGGWPGGAALTVTADDGNDCLQIEVTGAVATNISWGGWIEMQQIKF